MRIDLENDRNKASFYKKVGAENGTDCLLKSAEDCDILDMPLQ